MTGLTDGNYTDQAHMNREFKRWFGLPPSAVQARPDMLAMIAASGYR